MDSERPLVKFKKLDPRAVVPAYASAGAAGLDLRALESGFIGGHGFASVRTGLAIELSPGWEAQVRSRSGLASRHRVVVLNSPGTIDSDYRGEIWVLLFNHSAWPFTWEAGDRIAQLVIAPAPQAAILEVADLAPTERGGSGFGSTGVK